jgi:hypothetical protein
MEKFEAVFGQLFQVGWKLALKSLMYAVIFGLVIFAGAFFKEMPSDLFSIDYTMLISAVKIGVNAVWDQFLIVATPFLISFLRTDKS